MFTLENVHHLNRVDFLIPLKYNVTHNPFVNPVKCRHNIQQALKRENFQFHRTCSLDVSKEYNAVGKQTFLIFRGFEESDSRATISLTTSSCSSFRMASNTPNLGQTEKELHSTEQQTDISCRYAPGVCSPGSDEPRMLRAQTADSLTFSSPPSSVMHNTGRSLSILGSVCAMLLAKQGSTTKEVSDISSRQSMNICRICFGGESSERLVRPCSCRGTVAAVHRACLERWLLQACTSYCELCRHHYTVTRKHKWSLVRSVWEWARSGCGRALLADAWRGAALGAASLLGTARALHAADYVLRAGARGGGGAALAANLFSSVLIGIIGALNGLLTTWILLKIQEHQASWRTWRDGTVHVRVALDEPTPSPSPALTPTPSDDSYTTVVCESPEATVERSTNIADPFMVSLPFVPDPQ